MATSTSKSKAPAKTSKPTTATKAKAPAKAATATKAAAKPAAPKAAVAKAAPAKAAAKPATKAAKPAAKRSAGTSPVTTDQRRFYVEVAAYYIAERRGFHGGSQIADWVQAEKEIDQLLADGRINA